MTQTDKNGELTRNTPMSVSNVFYDITDLRNLGPKKRRFKQV